MEYIELARAIRRGDLDDAIPGIHALLRQRVEVISATKAGSLSSGDEFQLTDQIKPKLLAGARCKVISFQGTKIQVQLLENRGGKWSKGVLIRVPRTLIGNLI